MPNLFNYYATIINVVDGDTYDVDIDLGFHIHIHERIRVLNLDTPECRGKERILGQICKQYAKNNFLNKKVILNSKEEIKGPQTDSFGRWLCNIYFLNSNNEIYDDIANHFSSLGCNKYKDNYNENSVLALL